MCSSDPFHVGGFEDSIKSLNVFLRNEYYRQKQRKSNVSNVYIVNDKKVNCFQSKMHALISRMSDHINRVGGTDRN